jgi:acyl-coenzyme A thioesterase PaaI-like protein
MAEILPQHGPCFVCGSANPRGLGLTLRHDGGRVFTDFDLDESAQGPPGLAHGGAIAAILDEVMGGAVWLAGHRALLASFTADYRHPTSLGARLRAEAWLDRVEGRKIYALSRLLLPDGNVAVEGRGLYVQSPLLAGKVTFG